MSGPPTFVVVGAGKSGTTSLYRYLGEHPEIGMSRIKATNYFVHGWLAGWRRGPGDTERVHRPATDAESYRELFPAGARATGEVSPLYLYVPGTAERLAAALGPELRVVAILRDPVDAAYSYYRMLRGLGLETEDDFGRALELEDERVERRWSPAWHYTRRGLYHRQLEPYAERFPAASLRVYLYDELSADAAGLMRDLYGFLGVDPSFAPDLGRRYNVSGRRRRPLAGRLLDRLRPSGRAPAAPVAAPRIEPAVRRRLRALFADDLARLERLLGRALPASWSAG